MTEYLKMIRRGGIPCIRAVCCCLATARDVESSESSIQSPPFPFMSPCVLGARLPSHVTGTSERGRLRMVNWNMLELLNSILSKSGRHLDFIFKKNIIVNKAQNSCRQESPFDVFQKNSDNMCVCAHH